MYSNPIPSQSTEVAPAVLASLAQESDPEPVAGNQVDTTLKAETILIEEFKHASASAHDARQGRANLFYVYILGVGALVTFAGALFQLYSSAQNYVLLVLALTIAALLGGALSFAFYVKSLDLRHEYAEHMATMAVVKEFYIRELAGAMPRLAQAFRVRLDDAGDALAGGTLALEGAMVLLGSFFFGEAAREGYNLWVTFSTGRIVSAEASAQGRLVGLLVGAIALVAQVIFYYANALRYARRTNPKHANPTARTQKSTRIPA
jgi:hypothetical protein